METFCGEKRFEYWDDAEVVLISNADELIEKYTEQDGEHHYFDSNTMEFFGTEDFQMVAPGISVEYQANAPDGVDRWTIVSWIWNESGTMFTPYTLCRHNNFDDAAVCGHISYQELNKDWNAMEDEGFCSDHGENLQDGCSACADEEYEPDGTPSCFIHGYARDEHCRQCDSF
jgi:hypothetical protein